MDLDMMLNLQLFDGEGGDAAPSTGADGDGSASSQSGADAAVAALQAKQAKRHPLANVRYGRQPEAKPEAPAAEEQKADAQPEDDWNSIRNGKYKAQFDADVQKIVQERLKNSKQAEAKLQKLAPMIARQAEKYGIKDAEDVDALMSAYNDDDELYEQEALERGLSVKTLKQMKQLEAEHEQNERMRAEAAQQSAFQQHLAGLAAQAEELKKTYPSFDLRAEMQNPMFMRLTAPNSGIDLATAFFAVHRNEIQPQAMAVAAQKTLQMVSNNIQAGKNRPAENGVRNNPAVDVRDDPSKWSKADRDEVRRRVQRGEKIIL